MFRYQEKHSAEFQTQQQSSTIVDLWNQATLLIITFGLRAVVYTDNDVLETTATTNDACGWRCRSDDRYGMSERCLIADGNV